MQIRITLPGGKKIQEKDPTATMVAAINEAINSIGADSVFNSSVNKKGTLFFKNKSEYTGVESTVYNQLKECNGGLWVDTRSTTQRENDILTSLSDDLSLDWNVDLI